jgi:CCDC81-like prokaryotic HU domain 1/CCDC81-like prokaryotic HU domain 2/SPOR domain
LDITPFIHELLFGHDCVIVPELGGFIVNYAPARRDEATGTFYPPARQVSFNRNLSHNDGLLIGKISEVTGVNYGDARTLVSEFVASLKRRLEKGECIVLDRIGNLKKFREGNIQFEPDRRVNYSLHSYGLDPLLVFPVEKYDVRKRIMKSDRKARQGHLSLNRILWRAAVIVPLLGVLVAVPLKTNLFRTRIDSSTMNPLLKEEFEHNRIAVDNSARKEAAPVTGEASKPSPVEHAAPAGNTEKTEKKPSAPAVSETVSGKPAAEAAVPKVTVKTAVPVLPAAAPAANPVVKIQDGGYYLITGSFKRLENASLQANVLRKAGFKPEVYSSSNGFYRVCAMVCTDMNTAISKMDSVAKIYPGTWISDRK